MGIKIVSDIYSGILDLIYPPYCLTCGKPGEDYMCAGCIEKVDIIELPYCRKCGLPTETYYCTDCKDREFAFEQACSAGTYDGVLREAIHALKYNSHIAMADPLADLMMRCFPQTHFIGKVDVVVPIPIHSSRIVERGFNQSTELAQRFCKRITLPLETQVLYKQKRTLHQVSLSKDLRTTNVQGAFAVKNTTKLSGKRVLLIDDVFTTGSTLNEAAMILKDNGAVSVYAYTLARSI